MSKKKADKSMVLSSFVVGFGSLFSIFPVLSIPQSSPKDDWKNLNGDMQKIGDDFYYVMERVDAQSGK